jgi:hypothetical protein
MMPIIHRLLAALAIIFLLVAGGQARELAGRVVDADRGTAIADAIVTANGRTVSTEADGQFAIELAGSAIGVRAAGYERRSVGADAAVAKPIRLAPLTPKALYLSFYGIGSASLRNAALNLIHGTELNAVVIDIKSDRGLVAYHSAVPLATEAGAQKTITIPDLPALLQSLHAQNIYAIARIVTFKDDPLAGARPDWAVKRSDGSNFRDREGLRWVDPTRREVWDYDISIAVEAARAGFDEIQFDYLRFPDDKSMRLSESNNQQLRTRAIAGFLDAARQRLIPYNVFLAADVFGYICWNLDDTGIGQRLEDILPRVDYLSPMLYPSGFQFGIPGYPDPVAHVYEIVKRSLDKITARTHVSPRRIRPWLQAFKDYAFDRRAFDGDEIRQQIRAADEFGSAGWMLWNPRNVYSEEDLERQIACR